MTERSEGREGDSPTRERIVATSDAVETETYYVETESFGEWTRSPVRYYSVGAAVAYARAFFPNWRIVEVSGV